MNSVWRTVLGLVLRGLFRGTAGSRNKDRKEKDEQNPSVTTSRDSSPRQGSQESKKGEN